MSNQASWRVGKFRETSPESANLRPFASAKRLVGDGKEVAESTHSHPVDTAVQRSMTKVFHQSRRRPSSSVKLLGGLRRETRFTCAAAEVSSSIWRDTCVVALVINASLQRKNM